MLLLWIIIIIIVVVVVVVVVDVVIIITSTSPNLSRRPIKSQPPPNRISASTRSNLRQKHIDADPTKT